VSEELERLADRHLQYVGDVLALETNFERLAVVALAVTLLARHIDVGQEVHLDLDLAVALADLATAALDVEGEAPRLVAAGARLGRPREQVADLVEQADVGRRVRRGVRPIGDWSTEMILSSCWRPLIERCAPARTRLLPRRFATDLNRTSLMSVDLPEPETPVTLQSTPSGTLTSMS